ncbi:MAG: sugar phosphate isomerase/epimerase [Clostridia bacterium]|nr:sugar phosphate isomerase/epimerase [Clostridia bacterium]
MDKKISIATGHLQRKFGDMRAIEIAKEIGADAIDFETAYGIWDYRCQGQIYSKSDDEICEYFTTLRRRADEIGIEIGQTHGRIAPFNRDEEHNAAQLINARLDCMVAGILGAKDVVMHNVAMGPETTRAEYQKLSEKMFCSIIPFAKKYGVHLATETFGDSEKYKCLDFFGQMNEFIINYNRIAAKEDFAEHFKMCADTGHSNKAMRFGQPTPADCIRMMGKNLTCLHLNDNDTFADQHKTPGMGTIDWNDVFDALDEIGYDGNYNMELELSQYGDSFIVEMAEFSIKVLRHMLTERYGK